MTHRLRRLRPALVRRVALVVAAAAITTLGAATAAKADAVFDTTYGTSDANTYYNNYAGSSNNAYRSPLGFGSWTDAVSGGGNSASTTYDYNASNGFKTTYQDARTGTQYSYAGSWADLYFTVDDATTSYSMSGSYTFSSPYAWMYSYLYDFTAGQAVYSYQYTYNNSGLPGGTFTVGGTEGQYNYNYNTGNLSGLLQQGHHYRYYSQADIEAYPSADAGATASGSLTLALSDSAHPSPDAVTTPLPSTAWAGLGLLGCVGGAQVVRRRKGAASI